MTILEKDQQYIWRPYTQMKTADPPLPIVRGEGALLFDESGNRYIDAISSWWVNIHGHGHPYIAEKLAEQARRLEHVIFAGFTHPPAVELAERLLSILPENQARIFYSDNGSTAVEIAIKMAIQFYHNQGVRREKLIAFDRAFHGETFGAMSASGDLSFNNAFSEHLFEVLRIPAPVAGREEESIAQLETMLDKHSVYAFLFEPLILGAGGMLMYRSEVLDSLIAICRERNVLCIADEVMTGFGRTGRLFASDYLVNKPDLMAMSKGLTGGTLPLAVTSCTAEVFNAFLSDDRYKTFFHGHSFTGNPLGCAAALASLDLLQDRETQENMARIERSHQRFRQNVRDRAVLKDIRQRGTILALEFDLSGETSYFNEWRDWLYRFFMKRGVLLRPLGNIIYVMPPYCITEEQLGEVYQALEEAMAAVYSLKTENAQ
jgi:adenosylmethionine-8-amino-7-oxononanoate aminotransferase